jgi:hypothetical protein
MSDAYFTCHCFLCPFVRLFLFFCYVLTDTLRLYRRAANPPAPAPIIADPTPPPLPDRALKQSPAARSTTAAAEEEGVSQPAASQATLVPVPAQVNAPTQATLAPSIPVSVTGSTVTLLSRTDASSLNVAPQDGPAGMLPVRRRTTHAPTLAELEAMSSDEGSPAANMPPPYLGPIPTSFPPTQLPVFNLFPAEPPGPTTTNAAPTDSQAASQLFTLSSVPPRAQDPPTNRLTGPTGIEEDEDDYLEDEKLAREMAEAEMRQAT